MSPTTHILVFASSSASVNITNVRSTAIKPSRPYIIETLDSKDFDGTTDADLLFEPGDSSALTVGDVDDVLHRFSALCASIQSPPSHSDVNGSEIAEKVMNDTAANNNNNNGNINGNEFNSAAELRGMLLDSIRVIDRCIDGLSHFDDHHRSEGIHVDNKPSFASRIPSPWQSAKSKLAKARTTLHNLRMRFNNQSNNQHTKPAQQHLPPQVARKSRGGSLIPFPKHKHYASTREKHQSSYRKRQSLSTPKMPKTEVSSHSLSLPSTPPSSHVSPPKPADRKSSLPHLVRGVRGNSQLSVLAVDPLTRLSIGLSAGRRVRGNSVLQRRPSQQVHLPNPSPPVRSSLQSQSPPPSPPFAPSPSKSLTRNPRLATHAVDTFTRLSSGLPSGGRASGNRASKQIPSHQTYCNSPIPHSNSPHTNNSSLAFNHTPSLSHAKSSLIFEQSNSRQSISEVPPSPLIKEVTVNYRNTETDEIVVQHHTRYMTHGIVLHDDPINVNMSSSPPRPPPPPPAIRSFPQSIHSRPDRSRNSRQICRQQSTGPQHRAAKLDHGHRLVNENRETQSAPKPKTQMHYRSSSSARRAPESVRRNAKSFTVPKPFSLSGELQQKRTRVDMEKARRRTKDVDSRRVAFKARPMPDFSKPYPPPVMT